MMKLVSTTFLFIGLCAQLAPAEDNQLTPEEAKQGWILLFDGKTLNGWMTSDSKPSQRPVEDGTLNPHKSGAYMLVTKKEFDDFKLQLDFKLSPRCNSGVFFRVFSLTPQPGKDIGYNGIEVAIDDTKTADYVDPGAIYDLSKPTKNTLLPLGEWNHLVLTSRDNRATIELNGEVVNEVDFNKFTERDKRPDGTPHKFGVVFKDFPRRGRIGLQDHGADIWYKNIKVLPLDQRKPADDAAAARRARGERDADADVGTAASSAIWDRPIMAQQFDEKPVRAIRVPEWLEGITNYCYGATAYLEESESHGVQMTELAFGDPDYLRYPSKFFQMDPRASPDDLTKQVAEVRRRESRGATCGSPLQRH